MASNGTTAKEIAKLERKLDGLEGVITNLRTELGNKEEYHQKFVVALALFALGIGVQFLPVGSVGRIPQSLFAFILYLAASVRVFRALNSESKLKGLRKTITNVGVSILFIAVITLSLPWFVFLRDSTLPERLMPYSLLLAAFGFVIIETSIGRIHEA